VRGKLFVDVVDDGILGRGAAELAGMWQKAGSVPASGWMGVPETGVYGRYVNLVHVVGLGGDVDGLRETVIPGGIVLLEVVVGVSPARDASQRSANTETGL